ncbi:MAG: hypothetical protein ACXAC5_03340 [Promethearchaeota archaeon]|jgi:hypothetical protein
MDKTDINSDQIQELWKFIEDDQLQELWEFVVDIATGPHNEICPLNHPAYRHKWCNCCEAKKLINRLAARKSDDN